jgi:hypothetical protein
MFDMTPDYSRRSGEGMGPTYDKSPLDTGSNLSWSEWLKGNKRIIKKVYSALAVQDEFKC